MVKLADGTCTTDIRMDRLFDWDDRNLDYPTDKLLTAAEIKKPRSYTWKVGTLLDQGVEGSCVGYAFAHELIARPAVWEYTDRQALDLYYAAQKIDPWPGGEYPGARPIMAGTSILAGVKTMKTQGLIREYRWAKNVDELARAVGHKGPAVLGCNWYEQMVEPVDGVIKAEGRVVGGHALIVNGVSQTKKTFTLTNSWGPSWGVKGAAKISFQGMKKLLGANGEAVIPVLRGRQK